MSTIPGAFARLRKTETISLRFVLLVSLFLTSASLNTVMDHSPANGIPNEDRIWAMLCHALTLLQLAGMYLTFQTPFVMPVLWTLIVPLAIWLAKRDSSRFVDAHGRESINFQLTVLIIQFLATVVFWIVGLVWLAYLVIEIAVILLVIIAAVRASEGRYYEYPFSIRFLGRKNRS